ncbi:MAG: thiamine phosphate synthase [Candidatus Woesearchaeota archaeon]|jgi:thiamine-phosphate pyrophosphorylase|nr:thiamine phosphate synthase [Candidatus Woesearchaeota archaeon]MDP7322715.1 thiamine phosphate synthase [Candidatus Woesearchaeota archaeon]MDP7476445.1 thiamine phosphate synthase [Candidatus Woesearchaeota archaeon]
MKNFDFNNKLYVITESTISKGRNNEEIVREAIKGGAEIIQLREKDLDKNKIKNEAIRLLKICRENNVLFIVNDYVDVALEIGADGVHLGQTDMSISEARKVCRNKLIIGLSTHSVEQAIKADKEDVDYITIGPIYKTRAKDFTVGTEIIKEVVSKVEKPVIAIGGINKNNIDEVLKQGIKSVAVISAVVSAENVKEAAKKLVQKIKQL